MHETMKRAATLVFAGALALAGCAGDSGDPGAPGQPGDDGTDGLPGFSTAGGLSIEVTDLTINPDNTVSIRFEMKDDRGYPVDRAGVYSINSAFNPRFGLAYITKDALGNVLPYNVLSKSNGSPTAFTPNGGTAGTLVENGTHLGDYTYTFPASAALDPTKLGITHTIWIQGARQTDPNDRHTITPVNHEHNFIPAGNGTVERREVVSTANCNNCHNGFRIYAIEEGFHGGARYNANFCGICHNPERQSGRDSSGIPAAEAARFVHRIHYAEHLRKITSGTSTVGYQGHTQCTTAAPCTCTPTEPCQPTVFHGIGHTTYPQSVKNCRTCHEGGAQGNQRTTRPNRAACGACHDYVDFVDGSVLQLCSLATDAEKNLNGCRHSGSPQATDANCSGCHDTAYIEAKHMTPIETPHNPFVPPGLVTFEYTIRNVVVRASDNRPAIEFRIIKGDGATSAPATFDPFVSGTSVMLPGFTSGPSFYAAYSMPFMGITEPADFDAGNATTTIGTSPASVSLANVWNGKQGELLGPDPEGFYTAILGGGTQPNTDAVIPADAARVTGVMIGSFNQTNAETATNLDLNGDGDTTDGLNILAKAVYKVATGYTGRRQIVSDAKCSACHEQLGFDTDGATFHSGARNNGEICAICHNPIRNSSGWSGNMKDFVHAIHAAGGPGIEHGIRTNRFGWHASEEYWNVTFPSNLNNCEACHLPGTYDFSAAAYTDNRGELLSRLLPSTATSSWFVAALDPDPVPTGATRLTDVSPPWLAPGDYRDVGTDKSANLVVSPIASPCLACHDSPAVVSHMRLNGAQIYVRRDDYVAGTEACLVCHGPGHAAAIRAVHSR